MSEEKKMNLVMDGRVIGEIDISGLNTHGDIGEYCKFRDCSNRRNDGRCSLRMLQFYFNNGSCANYLDNRE